MKTIVIMPAYNAENTLEKTLQDIPYDYVDEIILVDDASKDDTVSFAEKLGSSFTELTLSKEEYQQDPTKTLFTIESLPENRGYGGNQKKCYQLALSHGADIIIMLHPDYQYDPKVIKYFVEFMKDDMYDTMLGSRIRSRSEALACGMPPYKYYANRFLTLVQNIASGRSLSEWHTGMRAYKREVLENIDFESFSDDFVFDTQMLFQIVEKKYSIGEVPVPVRYFEEASSIDFRRSTRYGFLTLYETFRFLFRSLFIDTQRYKRFVRYIVAGFSAFLFNMSIYFILLNYFYTWYIQAGVMAFVAGAVVSFILQKYWVFKNKSLDNVQYQLLSFIFVLFINLFLNTITLYILVDKMHFHQFYSGFIASGFVALWSFFMYKYVTFKER